MKLSTSIIRFNLIFAIVALLGGCGGGGGGVPAVSLDAVSPLFSNGADNNGAKWNDYVAGSNWRVTNTDAAECSALTDSACIHGGERRVVDVTGRSSCAGLSATDDLGVFDWVCDASTNPVRMVSTGLTDGKYLSHLLNFTTPGFRKNADGKIERHRVWQYPEQRLVEQPGSHQQ